MRSTFSKWKTADVMGQVAMVLLPLIYATVSGEGIGTGGIGILIMLGAWQTLSFLMHIGVQNTGWKAEGRRLYTVMFLLVLIGGAFALIGGNFVLIFFYCLLFFGPLMGLLYFIVSIIETIKSGKQLLE